jgi:hypothetical protein
VCCCHFAVGQSQSENNRPDGARLYVSGSRPSRAGSPASPLWEAASSTDDDDGGARPAPSPLSWRCLMCRRVIAPVHRRTVGQARRGEDARLWQGNKWPLCLPVAISRVHDANTDRRQPSAAAAAAGCRKALAAGRARKPVNSTFESCDRTLTVSEQLRLISCECTAATLPTTTAAAQQLQQQLRQSATFKTATTNLCAGGGEIVPSPRKCRRRGLSFHGHQAGGATRVVD